MTVGQGGADFMGGKPCTPSALHRQGGPPRARHREGTPPLNQGPAQRLTEAQSQAGSTAVTQRRARPPRMLPVLHLFPLLLLNFWKPLVFNHLYSFAFSQMSCNRNCPGCQLPQLASFPEQHAFKVHHGFLGPDR